MLRVLLVTLWIAALGTGETHSAEPLPPCGSQSHPAYPKQSGKLKIRIWKNKDLAPDWQPPACTGWQGREFSIMLAAVGRFNNPRGIRGILEKSAKISTLSGLRYWSVSRNEWATLIDEAYALKGPSRNQRRKDFALHELQIGRKYHYWQKEQTTAGEMIYHFRLLEKNPGRLVMTVENASPGEFLGITILGVGEGQHIYFFERLDKGVWGYYSLARINQRHDWFPIPDASYANRATAVFRHFADLREGDLPIISE
jgi:Family of unknown function (DUF6675)